MTQSTKLGPVEQEWPNRTWQRLLLRFGIGGACLALGLAVAGLDPLGFYGVFVLLFAFGSAPFLIRDLRTTYTLHANGLHIKRGRSEDVILFDDIVEITQTDGSGGYMEQFERAALGLLVIVMTFELSRPVIWMELRDGDEITLRGAVLPHIEKLYWRIRQGMGDLDLDQGAVDKLNHPSFRE